MKGFILPLIFERFKKLPEWLFKNNSKYINSEKFIKINSLKIIKKLDDKFSCKIKYQSIEFNLLNDYGDEDIVHTIKHRIPAGYIHIFTPCIVRNDFVIEVADIVFKPYSGVELINHRFAVIPDELHHLGIDVFRGKNAFFFFARTLSLQITLAAKPSLNLVDLGAERIYKKLPRKYQHVESFNWINSPRIKLYTKTVK